jgi:hypothetical protein
MPADLSALERAAAGLMMPSESEAPFDAVRWPGLTGEPSDDDVRRLAGADAADPVEQTTLEHLFRNVAVDHDWHDDAQRANVPRFRALADAVRAALTDVRVYRVGTTQVQAFIVGRTPDGGWAGLHTTLVET